MIIFTPLVGLQPCFRLSNGGAVALYLGKKRAFRFLKEIASFIEVLYLCNKIQQVDLQKQIDYWTNGSKEDLITSELLINNNRLLHGLFWCHLTIEKAIKAHVVKCTQEIPPRTHNLIWLLEKTDLSPDDEALKLLGDLMVYQLEGRYPERFPPVPSKSLATNLLNKTQDFQRWLISKL